jgi:CBS domain-containing protein
VTLSPGETRTVKFTLDKSNVGFYDNRGNFAVEPGQIDVYAGSSSSAGLKQSFTVRGQEVTLSNAVNRVKEILDEKGHDVLRIEADATVFDAVKRMVEVGVGSLLVTEADRITGIFTERDYLRRMTLEGRNDKETAVREVMTSPLVVVTPETPIDECMAVMTDRRIRHLPVVEGGDVVGIVSIGDVVKFRSKQQSFEIQYLTDYITAR